MKKACILWMVALLLMVAGCSSDDETSPVLYNHWVLVSYVNETGEVLKEAKGYYYQITFNSDGTYSGQAYGNEMYGEYKCSGNGISISRPFMTKVYWEGSDPDDFFQEHLHEACTYQLSDKELRIYYSEDKYFKFRVEVPTLTAN